MKTIVWDVDDVLNEFMREWFENFWRRQHPECEISYEQIIENPPHKLLGVELEEYLASLDKFRLSGAYKELKPVPEVLSWFEENGERYRHAVLTKVPVAVAAISAEWVFSNFGKWVRSFHFIPSYRAGEFAPNYDEDKGTFLNYFGKAALFIDDTLANIEAAEKFGVKTLVFPRPWNKTKQTISQVLAQITKLL